MPNLKFRVWIKDESRYEPIEDNWFAITSNGEVVGGIGNIGNRPFVYRTIGMDPIIVEYSSSQSDKAEKPIFEGDILRVKLNEELTEIAPVTRAVGGFYWKQYRLSEVTHEAEIIGNVNANPELLSNA